MPSLLDYENEYFALNDEAAQLVKQMKTTSDYDSRASIRKRLKPIDKRRLDLLCLMDELREE
jgi:hypothetical protein